MLTIAKKWVILANTQKELEKISLILSSLKLNKNIEGLSLPIYLYKNGDEDGICHLTCYPHTFDMFFRSSIPYTVYGIEDLLQIEV